ncbi:MAG: hypothetical protein GXX85_17790 [Ignavibacteria bacterium]|nr:hypothetical protein [Ignavibacteria bacterium]
MDAGINKLPIGYWVKKTDELLTRTFENAHKENKLNKNGWQILNTIIVNKEILPEQLESMMIPLMNEFDFNDLVNELSERNLISLNGCYKPTEEGIAFHRKILNKQTTIRNAVMKDISQEEYEITVSTLQRIIKNLGRV